MQIFLMNSKYYFNCKKLKQFNSFKLKFKHVSENASFSRHYQEEQY